MAGQPGLFDLDERYAALSRTGDPLERLATVVDFEVFRADLDAALARSDRSKGGRPPMDAVMMFKVLVIQALYGLADEQTEFQIRDRLSFMRFLGLDCQPALKRDPLSALKRDPSVGEGLTRRSYATAQARQARVGCGWSQTRFLKRQLSLPVSTMSQ